MLPVSEFCETSTLVPLCGPFISLAGKSNFANSKVLLVSFDTEFQELLVDSRNCLFHF